MLYPEANIIYINYTSINNNNNNKQEKKEQHVLYRGLYLLIKVYVNSLYVISIERIFIY